MPKFQSVADWVKQFEETTGSPVTAIATDDGVIYHEGDELPASYYNRRHGEWLDSRFYNKTHVMYITDDTEYWTIYAMYIPLTPEGKLYEWVGLSERQEDL